MHSSPLLPDCKARITVTADKQFMNGKITNQLFKEHSIQNLMIVKIWKVLIFPDNYELQISTVSDDLELIQDYKIVEYRLYCAFITGTGGNRKVCWHIKDRVVFHSREPCSSLSLRIKTALIFS